MQEKTIGFDREEVVCPFCKSTNMYTEETQLDSDDKTFLTDYQCGNCFKGFSKRYKNPEID